MNVPEEVFYNASGIDPDDRARRAFVWRVRGPDDCVLLGSGQLVGALGRPRGIKVGQFSITFPLPPGCAADELVVTDDATSIVLLPNVMRPCSSVLELRLGGRESAGDHAVRIAVANASPKIKPSTDNEQRELGL
jgi:hypothetical protein